MNQLAVNPSFMEDPHLLSITTDNKCIFLNENFIYNESGEVKIKLGNNFKGLLSYKTKPLFLSVLFEETTEILSLEIFDLNFIKVTEIKIKIKGLIDIIDISLDSLEENLYIFYQDINNNEIILIMNEEIEYSIDCVFRYNESIQTISSIKKNILYTKEKPGFGESAFISKWNDNKIIKEFSRFLDSYKELILHSQIENGTDVIYITNISTLQDIFRINLNAPIIEARMRNDDILICLVNFDGRIEVIEIDISRNKILSKKLYNFNIEIHTQVYDRIMIKSSSLIEGFKWGYLENESNLVISSSNLNDKINYIKTTYYKYPSSIILFEPLKKIKSVVICLHGGPESFEFDEIRYNGIYRDLVKEDIAVCVLNYKGSSYTPEVTRTAVWKNWWLVVDEILSCCKHFEEKYSINRDKISLLGGSFGATLSLLAASKTDNPFKNVVAIAPLVNLEKHLYKVSEEEVNWFKTRFSDYEIKKYFHYHNFLKSKCPIHIIQGDQDSVLDFEETVKAYEAARDLGKEWSLDIEFNSDHVPRNKEQKEIRYNYIYKRILG